MYDLRLDTKTETIGSVICIKIELFLLKTLEKRVRTIHIEHVMWNPQSTSFVCNYRMFIFRIEGYSYNVVLKFSGGIKNHLASIIQCKATLGKLGIV